MKMKFALVLMLRNHNILPNWTDELDEEIQHRQYMIDGIESPLFSPDDMNDEIELDLNVSDAIKVVQYTHTLNAI